MSNLISQLYNKILRREEVPLRPNLEDTYSLIAEAQVNGGFFTQNSIINRWVGWSPLEQQWYVNTDQVKAYFKNKNIGPGEVSVAIVIRKSHGPYERADTYETIPMTDDRLSQPDLFKNLFYPMMKHTGGPAVDVFDPVNKKYYEVKQATEKKDVPVGRHSRIHAEKIYRTVRESFEIIYNSYSKLTPEYKQLVEKYKDETVVSATFAQIMERGNEYFSGSTGELARGCIINSKGKSESPKLFLIPRFLANLVKSPEVKQAIPDEVEWIQQLYKVEFNDARLIDKMVRDYITRNRALRSTEPVTDNTDPELALSDFVLLCQTTVFANRALFEKEIVSVFTLGGEKSRQFLPQLFPNEGLFVVNKEGYIYAGKNQLSSLLRINSITKNVFKVIPEFVPEQFDNPVNEPAPIEDIEVATL